MLQNLLNQTAQSPARLGLTSPNSPGHQNSTPKFSFQPSSSSSPHRIRSFALKLREAEQLLDNLVDDYSDYRRPKRAKLDEKSASEEGSLKVSDILSYAQKISYTTFAPPEVGARALPPAPQDEQMRASELFKCADLDVGLPKIDGGKENIIEPLIELPEEETLPFCSNIVVPPGWKPGMPVELPSDVVSIPPPPPGWKPGMPVELPSDVVSIPPPPPGWKPGMPVELPSDVVSIPPPPPGWKPGDPITLPPIPRLPLQQPRPEPIQVRPVKLDFEDDSSSDYSSDSDSDNENIGLPKIDDGLVNIIEALIELPEEEEETLPFGWKPGMPVELPSDVMSIPPPPPGWKPGDPITLPPLQQPPPEPIQVRPVKLDFEDDSSDYSSDSDSDNED